MVGAVCRPGRFRAVTISSLLVGLLLYPAYTTTRLLIRESNANTRLLARAWIEENLPQGSHLLQEGYGPFLAGTTYVVTDKGTLANVVAAPFAADGNLQALRQEGYDYVVASSYIYNRYFAEPERYPDEINFYNQLFATGALIKEFEPAWHQSGPVLRIYQP